jgi:hypothetical protein
MADNIEHQDKGELVANCDQLQNYFPKCTGKQKVRAFLNAHITALYSLMKCSKI